MYVALTANRVGIVLSSRPRTSTALLPMAEHVDFDIDGLAEFYTWINLKLVVSSI